MIVFKKEKKEKKMKEMMKRVLILVIPIAGVEVDGMKGKTRMEIFIIKMRRVEIYLGKNHYG